MWIQVKNMMGGLSQRLDGLSKLTKIQDIKVKVCEDCNLDGQESSLRLYYRGKQMVDGHSLFDYDVGLNDVIQYVVVQSQPESKPEENKEIKNSDENKEQESKAEKAVEDERKETKVEDNVDEYPDSVYKLGDILDGRDPELGAWFEARLEKITKKDEYEDNKENSEPSTSQRGVKHGVWPPRHLPGDGYQYHVYFEGYEEETLMTLESSELRPRARSKLPWKQLTPGQHVMINYNYDEPKQRGYWYDAEVIRVKEGRRPELTVTCYLGSGLTALDDCKISFIDDVFDLERPGTQLNEKYLTGNKSDIPPHRENKPVCTQCRDSPDVSCFKCGCVVCKLKSQPEKQLMCDECDDPYHIFCLDPPLTAIPDEDEWYCPKCKNDSDIVKGGEKLKQSKKKSKMISAQNQTNRDWGKGMACVGRSKVCSIVPPNHFGPIPGVAVGTLWRYRVQVSEAGVHRPHVAGIHGQGGIGAFSIVLSAGYEDDVDNGDEFYYTGSGGRDLSGNKRTAAQSCDQLLTRMNLALAKNCDCPVNKKGGEAKDWQKGKAVRVVRNCKGRKHSMYAPEEGNRYDGIYKVIKYWPETGKSGFVVWRYLLRRDDKEPAPWTEEGERRIKQLGLVMQNPDGYVEESEKKKKRSKTDESDSEGDEPSSKRARDESKPEPYKLTDEVKAAIAEDTANKKHWQQAKTTAKQGVTVFLSGLEEQFSCICCMEMVAQPITTTCQHNVCKPCLSQSFRAEMYTCPVCRHELGKKYPLNVNSALQKVLRLLFPGYDSARS